MSRLIQDSQFQKNLIWVDGVLRLFLLSYDWSQGNLGANPPEAVIRTTGILAILFLALSLMVTPLVHVMKWMWLVKHRRALGLGAFFYGLIHLIAYSLFDKEFDTALILEDIAKRPFILLGFLGLVLMVPLAITSTNRMIQKMGAKKWRRLHQLSYVVAILVAIHFWLIVKSDYFYPGLFAVIFAVLLASRIYVKSQKAGP